MIITKKALPRRTFLKGVGATLALPLLDAMIPAATAATKTGATPVRRLGYVFMPMGCDITRWTPGGTDGKLGELSPILNSLGSVKEHVTAITNLELRNAYPGSHATSNSAFLSAASAVRMARRLAFPAATSGFPVSALLARARANRMTAAATVVCPRTGCSRYMTAM